jgi:hypothetical protein
MGVSVASAVASAHANGMDPLDAIKEVVNPASGRFGHVILGDRGSIGLGGPMRTFIRGMAPGYVNGRLVLFARVQQ